MRTSTYSTLLLLLGFGASFAPGAVPGAVADGCSDDTAAIQRAIDSVPAYGVVDGENGTYLVGTLKLKSRMSFQNFRLKVRDSAVPLTSPVTVDGTSMPVSEVRIDNVHVDGNRRGQTNLLTAEDGGRSGFRIAGVASDIWILNSSAVNCATDGLEIFSADAISSTGKLNFQNIYVISSQFDANRRHGASLDSAQNVNFIGVTFRNNGLAANAVGTPTEGEKAYLVDGMLYGAGLVFEGYNPRTGLNGLNVVGCTATGNARYGIQFWDVAVATAPSFTARSNIRVESCLLDGGVSPTHGRQAIEFNVPAANLSAGYLYRNVVLANNQIRGTVIVNTTSTFRMSGGAVDSPYAGFYGISRASRDIVTQSVNSAGKIFVQQ